MCTKIGSTFWFLSANFQRLTTDKLFGKDAAQYFITK